MSDRRVQPGHDDLVSRAKAGDRHAFGDLVRSHQHEVFTLALRLTGDRELAMDVSQEAFIRAWRAVHRFRGRTAFSTWMYRITANVASTHRSRAVRRQAASIDEAYDLADERQISPARAGEMAATAQRLDQALEQLPRSQRIVVVLKDVYGWTHDEIAQHIGISPTAAKVRLHRGRKRLRQELWSDR